MTARQSYHLTFARFFPSLSVKSFTASEAANTAYRVEITATSTDSSLPLSSYLNQRAAFEIRPQEAVLSEVASAFGSASDDLSTVYPICFTVDDVQVTIRTSLSSLNSTP